MNTEKTKADDRTEMLEYIKAHEVPEFTRMTEEDWFFAKNALQIFLYATKPDTVEFSEWAEKFGKQFNEFYQQYMSDHRATLYEWYTKALDEDPTNDEELLGSWEEWKEKTSESQTTA